MFFDISKSYAYALLSNNIPMLSYFYVIFHMSNDEVQSSPTEINLCWLRLLFVYIQINNYNGKSDPIKIEIMHFTPNKTIHM